MSVNGAVAAAIPGAPTMSANYLARSYLREDDQSIS